MGLHFALGALIKLNKGKSCLVQQGHEKAVAKELVEGPGGRQDGRAK